MELAVMELTPSLSTIHHRVEDRIAFALAEGAAEKPFAGGRDRLPGGNRRAVQKLGRRHHHVAMTG